MKSKDIFNSIYYQHFKINLIVQKILGNKYICWITNIYLHSSSTVMNIRSNV